MFNGIYVDEKFSVKPIESWIDNSSMDMFSPKSLVCSIRWYMRYLHEHVSKEEATYHFKKGG